MKLDLAGEKGHREWSKQLTLLRMRQLVGGKEQQHLAASTSQILVAAIGAILAHTHIALVGDVAQLLSDQLIEITVHLRMLVEANGKGAKVQHNGLLGAQRKASHIAQRFPQRIDEHVLVHQPEIVQAARLLWITNAAIPVREWKVISPTESEREREIFSLTHPTLKSK